MVSGNKIPNALAYCRKTKALNQAFPTNIGVLLIKQTSLFRKAVKLYYKSIIELAPLRLAFRCQVWWFGSMRLIKHFYTFIVDLPSKVFCLHDTKLTPKHEEAIFNVFWNKLACFSLAHITFVLCKY
jgi:hypothetical protein